MIGPKSGTTQVNWTWRVNEEGLEQVCGIYFKNESDFIFYCSLEYKLACLFKGCSQQWHRHQRSLASLQPTSEAVCMWGMRMPMAKDPSIQPSHRCIHPADPQSFVPHALLVPLLPLPGFRYSEGRCEYLHRDHSPADKLQRARGASKNRTYRLGVLLCPWKFYSLALRQCVFLYISYEYSRQGHSLTLGSKVKIINLVQSSSTENKCKPLG